MYSWEVRIVSLTSDRVTRTAGWQIRRHFRSAGFVVRERYNDRLGVSPVSLFVVDSESESAMTAWELIHWPRLVGPDSGLTFRYREVDV